MLFDFLGFITLTNAKQSSTYNDLSPNRAIDGNTTSRSVTAWWLNNVEWFTVQLSQASVIVKIQLYLDEYALRKGYYKRFKLETRMQKEDEWKTCKGEYDVIGPISPHEVVCDDAKTVAKYLRISVSGRMKPLYLGEVKVMGTRDEGQRVKVLGKPGEQLNIQNKSRE